MDLSGSMQGAGGVGGLLAMRDADSESTYHPAYDGNGNITEYLSSPSDVEEHIEYDPFGDLAGGTAPSDQFTLRFSTKPVDPVTGLYYYGYRWYGPLTGRWPSRDPIGGKGGPNLYGFVGNDGVNRWDDTGLREQRGERKGDHQNLELTFQSERLVLGECGAFSWRIIWLPTPAAGKVGGLILQEMRMSGSKADGTQLFKPIHYYEDWRVKENSTDVGIAMGFEEDPGERFISHPTDAWSDGVASDNGGIVTLKPAYDGTEGSQTYEGWARYRDPVAEADIFKELPGEVPNALDLHSRFGSKGMPSFAGARESGIVHRKLKVSWCCTTGVSKESRQTKVDEALPARYGQDQRPIP